MTFPFILENIGRGSVSTRFEGTEIGLDRITLSSTIARRQRLDPL